MVTRTTPKLTPEESKIKSHIRKTKAKRKYTHSLTTKRRELIIKLFGNVCEICRCKIDETSVVNVKGKQILRINARLHRKDGSKHRRLQDMTPTEIEKIYTFERDLYAPVCKSCHNGVHWCMRTLGMSWDEIKRNKYNASGLIHTYCPTPLDWSSAALLTRRLWFESYRGR